MPPRLWRTAIVAACLLRTDPTRTSPPRPSSYSASSPRRLIALNLDLLRIRLLLVPPSRSSSSQCRRRLSCAAMSPLLHLFSWLSTRLQPPPFVSLSRSTPISLFCTNTTVATTVCHRSRSLFPSSSRTHTTTTHQLAVCRRPSSLSQICGRSLETTTASPSFLPSPRPLFLALILTRTDTQVHTTQQQQSS